MALIQDLLNQELLQTRPSVTCFICTLLESLPEDESAALTHALADPTITGSAIARVLTANNHKVAPGTVQRHRRQECHSAKG
jgi:hypothetical protein